MVLSSFPCFFLKKQIWERDSFHNMKKAPSEGLGELTLATQKQRMSSQLPKSNNVGKTIS